MGPSRPPEGRKTVILDAAARLFAERGYAAVGMDDIGAAVEISGPSLYWHFPSKEALLTAVLVAAVEQSTEALESLADREPPATFEDYLRAEIALVLDGPGYVRTLLRERPRLPLDDDEARRSADAVGRNERVARRMLAELSPGLGHQAAGIRLFSQIGALVALARSQPAVPRRRLEDLMVPSLLAVGMLPSLPKADRPSAAPRPRWQPQRGRGELILRASRQLFRERGFAGASMSAIAKAAGISRPTVYHYFGSKGEILAAAWERETMRFVVGAGEAVDGAGSAADALERLAAAHVAVVLDSLDLIDVLFGELSGLPEHQGSWPRYRRMLTETWGTVLAELRPGLSDHDLQALVDMVFGVATHAAMAAGGDHAWRDEIAALMVAFALG